MTNYKWLRWLLDWITLPKAIYWAATVNNPRECIEKLGNLPEYRKRWIPTKIVMRILKTKDKP